MLAMPSGIPACPDNDRQRRLAVQLADMIPGAITIRVSLTDPKRAWPHPHVIAKDKAGETIELSRTTVWITARWIMRVWPDADWTQPHTLDLANATLRGGIAATGRGR